MEKVTVIIQIHYLLEMSNFFTEAIASPVTIETPQPPPGGYAAARVILPQEDNGENGPVMTVYFSMKEPELVLLADPECQDCRTIVVNVSKTNLKYKSIKKAFIFIDITSCELCVSKNVCRLRNLWILTS